MDNKNNEIRIVEELIAVKNTDTSIDVSIEKDFMDFLSTDESIMLVDAPITETMIMETQTTDNCPYLESCRITNHALLHNRDTADQHSIDAITGLSDRLNSLETIDDLKSVSDVIGIYYPWYDSYDGNDRTGYFVSYHPDGTSGYGGIVIYDRSYDVMGVTVIKAGYVGNYAETVIDGITVGREDDFNYGLVALNGIVNVRTTGNPVIGGYVVANEYGMAEPTDNLSGYRVLAKGNNGIYDFVTIFLGVSQNSLAILYDTVAGLSEFTEEDRQRLQDCVTSDELAEVLSQLEITVNENINSAVGKVEDDLGLTKEELEELIGEAKKDAESAQSSAEAVQKQVTEVNNTVAEIEVSVQSDIDNMRTEMQENISETKETVEKNLSDAMTEVRIIADNLNSISSEFAEGGIISTMQQQIDENSAKLENVVAGNLPSVESITQLKQQVDANGGLISSLVLDIQKYSVGQFSQSYGLSYDDAVSILVKGIIYVPIISHTENLIRDPIGDVNDTTTVLSAGTLEEREADNNVARLEATPFEVLEVTEMQTYDFIVLSGLTYRYEWDGSGWVQGAPVSTSSTYFEYDGTSETTDMWYCWQDVSHDTSDGGKELFEAGTLYAWRGDRWVAVAHVRDNITSRSINSVRQTAKTFSIQLQDIEGNYSLYRQTVDKIQQVVGGVNGETGNLVVTKDGIYGEVFNPNGTAATMRGQVDSVQAMIDLMTSGYYHKVEQTLSQPVPAPVGSRYDIRPQWSKSQGQFVFIDSSLSDNGLYYFFDNNKTHYCKQIGDYYEVYTIGDIVSAGTDIHINDQEAAIKTFASFDTGTGSTLAVIRNQALEDAAKIDLITSMSTDTLTEVVSPLDDFILPTTKYTTRPTWNKQTEQYVFDSNAVSNDGLYFVGGTQQQYRKLIPDGNGGYRGYEVYEFDSAQISAIVQQVRENEASIGLVVDNGEVQGGVIVDAINNQVTTTIDGDRLNIKGITTVSTNDSGSTVIDGSTVILENIQSSNYTDTDQTVYSSTGTKFDFSAGTIESKNFAIDSNGNAYFKGTLDACNGVFHGEIKVGAKSGGGYNFTVDASGNVIANNGTFCGIIDAADLQINGNSIINNMSSGKATDDSKIVADYLELRGIEIKNDDNETTFKIDANGNVTMIGDIILGSDSKITWDNVEDKPEFADVALSGSFDDLDGVPDIPVLPDYITETYIDSTEIRSPIIKANQFTVTPYTEDTEGGFYLKGYYYSDFDEIKVGDMFRITYNQPGGYMELPTVNIDAPSTMFVNWNVSFTKFNNAVLDFDGADVRNLHVTSGTVTAVFG